MWHIVKIWVRARINVCSRKVPVWVDHGFDVIMIRKVLESYQHQLVLLLCNKLTNKSDVNILSVIMIYLRITSILWIDFMWNSQQLLIANIRHCWDILFSYKNKAYKNAEPQIWWNLKNILNAQIALFFNYS